MKKISVFYILVSSLILGTPLYVLKGAIACEMSESLGYEEVRPNVFIVKGTLKSPESLDFMREGAKRVNDTFGATIASPMIILTENTRESRKFFASETATPHVSPFGM